MTYLANFLPTMHFSFLMVPGSNDGSGVEWDAWIMVERERGREKGEEDGCISHF